MLYVLDRTTGVPIFPVEERPVPASTVPGERASPTQPFSTLPALSPQRLDPDSIASYTPGIRAACQSMLKGLRSEGVFTPPSLEGSVVIPSNVGGAHWGGVAYDPDRGIVVVPVNHLAVVVQLIPAAGADKGALHEEGDRFGYETTRMHGTPYYMRRRFFSVPSLVRCTPPPYGALVAISLRTATKLWEVPLGVPTSLLTGLPADSQGLAAFGSANLGGAIATAGGLVFIAATPDKALRAFDIETGKKLWEAELPAGGKATPMTYAGRDGRQYVVIMAAGDGDSFGRSDEVVAFGLP
jgi:quinoprotein glucose dehydrogenase